MDWMSLVYKERFDVFVGYTFNEIGVMEDAKDLVQEAFCKIVSHQARYDIKGEMDVRRLVFKSLRYCILNYYRSRGIKRRNRHALDLYYFLIEDSGLDPEIISFEEILALVELLPQIERDVIYLTLFGKKNHEIANIVGQSLSQVNYYKSTFYNQVRRLIGKSLIKARRPHPKRKISTQDSIAKIETLLQSGHNLKEIASILNENHRTIINRYHFYRKSTTQLASKPMKKVVTEPQIKEIKKLRGEGLKLKDISKQLDLSIATVSRHMN